MLIRFAVVILLLGSCLNSASAQTAAEGKTAFTACAACHSIDGTAKPTGPSLKGIAGKKVASQANYKNYSAALKKSNIVWTDKELDAYLKSPTTRVKGTTMMVSVPDQKRRQSIIAYLKSLK
jgi:cytochrome c